MKKSGFTLIEAMLSIVIFTIITTSVFTCYAFSSKLFEKSDIQTYLQLYSKTIVNDFRSRDSRSIKSLYENGVKNSSGLAGRFIYFDNIEELSSNLKSITFSLPLQLENLNEYNNYGVKKFSAFCGFSKCGAVSSFYDTYMLFIKVFSNNSEDTNGVENEREFIIFK